MLQFLQRIFKIDHRSDLERFIDRHSPQSPGDIEHLMRIWGYKNQGSWL